MARLQYPDSPFESMLSCHIRSALPPPVTSILTPALGCPRLAWIFYLESINVADAQANASSTNC